LKAWQVFTHAATSPSYRRLRPRFPERALSRLGYFRDTPELREAWSLFEPVYEALEPSFLLFQTPATFHPSADHLRDMYRFFKRPRRGRAVWAWEPRGASWDDELVRRVCRDLRLTHAVDPLARAPVTGGARYFRLHGRIEGRRIDYGHAYSDAELRELAARCEGKEPAFVFFNNRDMWKDALRFRALADPLAAALRPRPARIARERWRGA